MDQGLEFLRGSVGAGILVLHAWHGLAAHTGSLVIWHPYDLHGRLVAGVVGVCACFVPLPQVGALWLAAMVCDVVGYHEIDRPTGYVPVSLLILCLSLVHPYASLGLGVVCGVWLGLVWQVRVRRRVNGHQASSRIVFLWSLGVATGVAGVVGGVFGKRVWSWGTVVSVLVYTLLFTGRFIPGVIHGTADPVRREPSARGGWTQLDPDGVVYGSGASTSSDDRQAARHDVQRLLDGCFDDSGHSAQEEWPGDDSDEA